MKQDYVVHPTDDSQWAYWYDIIGNRFAIGDTVVVATVSYGHSASLTVGVVDRINRKNSKGVEIGSEKRVWKGPAGPLPSDGPQAMQSFRQMQRDRQDLWAREFVPDASLRLDLENNGHHHLQTYQNIDRAVKVELP